MSKMLLRGKLAAKNITKKLSIAFDWDSFYVDNRARCWGGR